MSGLGIHEFDVIDNGVMQQVADMSYEKLPIDVTMALDVSESVTGALLDRLRGVPAARDRSRRPRSVEAHDVQHARETRDGLRKTSFLDRCRVREDRGHSGAPRPSTRWQWRCRPPAPPDRRQLIVLFSDGHDTSSITDPATLIDVAHRTTATLGFGTCHLSRR